MTGKSNSGNPVPKGPRSAVKADKKTAAENLANLSGLKSVIMPFTQAMAWVKWLLLRQKR